MHIVLYHKRIHFYVFNFYWYVFTTTEIAAVCRKKIVVVLETSWKKKEEIVLWVVYLFGIVFTCFKNDK